ncbi:hypothetical protein MMC21_001667 [Puttea exsequens]|nr:hypothetical protein [Puttea exsequens]
MDPNLPNDYGGIPADTLWDRAFAGHLGQEGISDVGLLLKDSDYIDGRKFSMLHKIVLGLVQRSLRNELGISTSLLDTVDAQGRTPVCWAVMRDEHSVRTLLSYKAIPNLGDKACNTPLHYVQSLPLYHLVLDADADLEARNLPHERSPLHTFCHGSFHRILDFETIGVIDILFHAGIYIAVRGADGETPLLHAVFAGLTAHARRLLELGANVNTANYSSRDSALTMAVHTNHHEILTLPLEKEANYDHTGVGSGNVAHGAARSGDARTMCMLAESNLADLKVDFRGKEGKTPADYLAERRTLVEA